MIPREISSTSIAISLSRYLFELYSNIEQKLIGIYQDSETRRLAKGHCDRLKICFRYSFLGRITEKKQTTTWGLNNSQTIQYLINIYIRCKNWIIQSFISSSTFNLAKNIKKQLPFSPLKRISIIIVAAITVNVILSITLQKQIGLWGWLMRGLFLFVGVTGLFCKADWPAVKRSSIILRRLGIN